MNDKTLEQIREIAVEEFRGLYARDEDGNFVPVDDKHSVLADGLVESLTPIIATARREELERLIALAPDNAVDNFVLKQAKDRLAQLTPSPEQSTGQPTYCRTCRGTGKRDNGRETCPMCKGDGRFRTPGEA